MQNTPPEPPPASDASECMMISEKQFMRDHTMYSALSSWLFAIAGATNIGLLSVLASKILTAVEQGKPVSTVMNNKKYNRVALGMIGFGAVCMAVSNWLESKKVVTEWQLGAGKLQRKVNIAEKERAQMALADPAPVSNAMEASACRNWAASVQSQAVDSSCANYSRHG